MRALIVPFLLVCLTPLHSNAKPSIDISGITITSGMPEAEVRALFPDLHCLEKSEAVTGKDNVDFCFVSGESPASNTGEIWFEDGYLKGASTIRAFSKEHGADQFFAAFNELLQTATENNERSVCAKIETHDNPRQQATHIVLPDTVVSVQYGARIVIKETLRVNPVPKYYAVKGDIMQGNRWCGFVN